MARTPRLADEMLADLRYHIQRFLQVREEAAMLLHAPARRGGSTWRRRPAGGAR
jgi:hypothetical protein